MKVLHIMLLVCAVYMTIAISRDIQRPIPLPPPPPPPQYLPHTPIPHTLYSIPTAAAEEEIVWMNGRPIHTPITPDDDQPMPWDTHTQQQQQDVPRTEEADILAKTLGKKQLDPFPILGTVQPTQQQEEEEEEGEEEVDEEEEEEEEDQVVSSLQIDE